MICWNSSERKLDNLAGPRILVEQWWATFWVSALSVWAAIWTAKYWDRIVNEEDGMITNDRSGRQENSPHTSALAHQREIFKVLT